jgi:adenosylhomocysteine nucleosidase
MSKIIGIIGAMDIEVDSLISDMTEKSEKIISGIKFVKGKLENKDVVIAKCGIGKVFAALCAQTLILEYKPDIIINTGIAGAVTKGLSVLDVVVADKVVQHDMDTSAIGDPKGLISGINVIYIDANKDVSNVLAEASKNVGNNTGFGIIASGDKFIADKSQKEQINNDFGAVACEMEGAAIGQVCYVNNVPFSIIRTISDGDGAEMDYMTFAKEAALRSIKTVKKFIEII